MVVLTTMAQFFKDGGPVMFFIGAVAVMGFSIAVERWLFFVRSVKENGSLWQRMQPLMDQGDLAGAEQLAEVSNSAIGRVLSYGFARSRAGSQRSDIEMAMEERLMEITAVLEKRTHYLATFANIATLLSFIGTISGLIRAFAAIASLNLSEKTNVLSLSISEALNATAFGLLVAVPLLLLHAWLNSRAGELVDSLEMAPVNCLHPLKPPAWAPDKL